jgi:dolichol-phosphate mannosyltransferase
MQISMTDRILAVIPTYNEREHIAQLLAQVCVVLPEVSILVVDDGSPDGTGDLVVAAGQQNPRIRLIRRKTKQGLGSAYRTGFHAALTGPYKYIIQLDADFSHDPRDLWRLLEAAETGADVVIGSRYVRGSAVLDWPLSRRLISRGANWLAGFLLGQTVGDCTSGFRCFRSAALQSLVKAGLRSSGFSFQVEVVHMALCRGLRVREVPIRFVGRRQGRSKLGWRDMSEWLRFMLRTAIERKMRHQCWGGVRASERMPN